MYYLPGILALLTGVAGWFYLFYSRAAHGLAGIEDERLNRRRVGLRRVGGLVMLLLGVAFYVGFYAADPRDRPRLFLAVWVGVVVLLGAIVILALVDVRLTYRLRHRRGRSPTASNHPGTPPTTPTTTRGTDLDRLPPP